MKHSFHPMYILLLLLFPCIIVTAQTPFWEQSNGPYEASVQAVAFAPNGIIFIGTSNGCFRSTDEGRSWVAANSSLREVNFTSLLVTNDNTLIAGSRDSVIYRSTNWGEDWTRIVLPVQIINDIIEHRGNIFLAARQGGVLRSGDDGITWEITDTTILKAATEIEISNNYLIVGNYQGIFRSSDLGTHWIKSNSGINGSVFSLSSSISGDLFASASPYGGASLHRLFRSIDTGKIWIPVDTTVLAFDHVMTMHATSTGELFVYSALQERKLYKLINRGVVWDTVSWPSNNRWFTIQTIKMNNPGQLIVGTDHSLFLSNNNGVSWTETSSGLTAARILNVIPTPNNNVFGVSLHGFYRSTDQGVSWNLTSNFAPPLVIALDDGDGNDVIIGRNGTGIHNSIDNGKTWQTEEIPSGHDDIIALAKGLEQEAYYSEDQGKYIYSSVDLGQSWERGNTSPSKLGISVPVWLTVDGKGRIITLLSKMGEALISSDKGNTWTEIPHTVSSLRRVFAHPLLGSFIGITYNSIHEFQEVNGQWEVSDLGFLKPGLTSVVFSSKGEIFVSAITSNNSMGGVYVRRVDGSWDSVLTGLPVRSVNTLTIGKDGRLYAATSGGSIVRSVMPVSQIDDKPKDRPIATIQISPNPTSTNLSIHVWMPSQKHAVARLYSCIGQLITTCYEGNLSEGEHNVMVDTTLLTTGLYLLKIEQGLSIQTYPIMIVR